MSAKNRSFSVVAEPSGKCKGLLCRFSSCGWHRMERFRIQQARMLLRILLARGIIVSDLVAIGLGVTGHFVPHTKKPSSG